MNHTQKTIQETIPSAMVSLQKDIEAFKFQAEPRINRANEQVQELQTHIANFSTEVSEESSETQS